MELLPSLSFQISSWPKDRPFNDLFSIRILQSAEKIIIEYVPSPFLSPKKSSSNAFWVKRVNTALPSFEGLHDINESFLPPHRQPYVRLLSSFSSPRPLTSFSPLLFPLPSPSPPLPPPLSLPPSVNHPPCRPNRFHLHKNRPRPRSSDRRIRSQRQHGRECARDG